MEVRRERINVYVSPEVKAKVIEKADEMGITLSAFAAIAINEYLKQESVVDLAEMLKEFKKSIGGVEK